MGDSPPKKQGWKKNDKPTYTAPQEYDHEPMYESETYEKEPVYYNPYDIRKRRSGPSAMKAQMADDESYEKEAVSHIYNPYDIRQRGIVKAQLEERIESDMQELAALDELETVSNEQQDSADVLLNENGEVREFDDFPFDDSADLND